MMSLATLYAGGAMISPAPKPSPTSETTLNPPKKRK
jgi:hypothetical protein